MIPTAISDGKYGSWQEQELWDEYEFLKMQLKESDPVVLKEKIEALAVRLGIS